MTWARRSDAAGPGEVWSVADPQPLPMRSVPQPDRPRLAPPALPDNALSSHTSRGATKLVMPRP